MSPTRYIIRLAADYILNYLSLFNTPDFNQSVIWDCILEYAACIDYGLDKESFLDASMEFFNDLITRHPRFSANPDYFTDKFIESITRIGDYVAPYLRHILDPTSLHRLVYVHYYTVTGELIVDYTTPMFTP